MKPSPPLQHLWIVAMALLLVGLGLGLPTARHAHRARTRLERQHGHIRKLLALQQDIADSRQVRNAFERLPVKQPVAIETLTDSAAPPHAKIRMAEPVSIPPSGWTLARADIEFGEQPTDIGAALAWAASVETRSRNSVAAPHFPGRPPWRLVHASIHASPTTPGQGDVLLAFEALEKIER